MQVREKSARPKRLTSLNVTAGEIADIYAVGEKRKQCMFESWLVVKFEYLLPPSTQKQTKMVGYEHLMDAERTFFDLQTSYRLDTPILVMGDKRIAVTGVWLYRASKFERHEAFAAVEAGDADLLYEARGLLVDLDEK